MILILRKGVYGFAFLAFVYGTVEIADAFALLTGKLFGRTPLVPRLSPRKTVEGFAGGLFAGGIAGLLLARYFFGIEPAESWPLVGIVLAAGTLGDLLTSALKRARGKKDFPPVLPAHGGVIDIYDSFLFAAPIFLAWNLA
jgi:phosphatidate cytidylyltransferase